MLRAAPRTDRGDGARRARSQPARHRGDDPLQRRRHGGAGRRGFSRRRRNYGPRCAAMPRPTRASPTIRSILQDLTPWPANMSWALLADRSSCFAGRELALAFAPLPPDRREAINAQFIRVFAGTGHGRRCRRHGEEIWLRCRRRRAAGRGLEQRSVCRKPRLSAGGNARRPMADLRREARPCGAVATQIPANQLKPCLLQNVSRKSLVTSIALIHFAFL